MQNKAQIQDLRKSSIDIHDNIKKSKPFYRFWYTKHEKALFVKARKLLDEAYSLEQENLKLEKDKFFDAYTAHKKIKRLLIENSFVLTNSSSSGGECSTKTDIWTLEEWFSMN